jgi:hypothetical protein
VSLHVLVLTTEIMSATIAGLWLSAYATAGLRYLLHGKDIPEVVDAAFIAKYLAQAAKEKWYHRILETFDVFVNVIARGEPDETISTRSYRALLEGKLWGRAMSYFLNLYQPQHGPKACVGDLYRAQSRALVCRKILGID